MMAENILNVIIVNYKTPSLTIRCIESIVSKKIALIENIIVVDNLSLDDSIPLLSKNFPDLNIISSNVNKGFGAGVNLGISVATAEFIMVLNPDTYFLRDSVTEAINFIADHQDTGIVGLDLVNPDGSRQYSARRFYSLFDIVLRRLPLFSRLFRKREDRHLMKEAWAGNLPFEAEWVMGTGFVMRRDLLAAIGGMDERYFLYMEDVDLCARVWRSGRRVTCLPGAELVHDHQRSSKAGLFSKAGRQHLSSLYLFARKFDLPLVRQPGLRGIFRQRR